MGVALGLLFHAIAALLGRAASTISRKVTRNGGRGRAGFAASIFAALEVESMMDASDRAVHSHKSR